MPLVSRNAIERAVRNVATWGDTDVFPFPIENHVFHDSQQQVVDLLEEVAKDFEASLNAIAVLNYSTLAPVGYTGFRWATQIDPLWNIYLLALVLEVAPALEALRVSDSDQRVFSYRYRPASSGNSIFATDGWSRFQEATRSRALDSEYVVAVDIADFYARIYHHRLENALRRADPPGGVTRHIMKLLGLFSSNTSYGIPVGGPAARLLAEVLLNNVDHLLIADKNLRNFCRYADDYRFFVDDTHAAHRVIAVLSEKLLRNEGLTLQKAKTRIMSSKEYLSLLDPPSPPAGSAAAFLNLHIHYDPYSATAVEDYERLKSQLSQFDVVGLLRSELRKGRIQAALVRRLVAAIQYMDEPVQNQALLSLLENLEVLAPVVPQVMLALRECLPGLDAAFVAHAHGRIRQLISEDHFLAQIDLNLAYMIRALAIDHTVENEQLLIQLYNGPHGFGSGVAPNIQRDILLILGKWKVAYWLSDQKNYMVSAHPWVRRAFIVASYTLGDEGRYWRDAYKSGFSGLDVVVRDWAAQKQSLPTWEIPV